MTLGDALEAQRLARGQSQREAGEAIGVSQQVFDRYTKGVTRPDQSKRAVVARYLGLNLRDYDAMWERASTRPNPKTVAVRLDDLEAKIDALTQLVEDALGLEG